MHGTDRHGGIETIPFDAVKEALRQQAEKDSLVAALVLSSNHPGHRNGRRRGPPEGVDESELRRECAAAEQPDRAAEEHESAREEVPVLHRRAGRSAAERPRTRSLYTSRRARPR